MPRKIIYRAEIQVLVQDFAQAEQQIAELIKAEQGYIAHRDVRGSPGSPRSGHWTLRVPVDAFDEFVQALTRLGELQKNSISSEDKTGEYYDLETLIKDKQREAEELLKLFDEARARHQKEPKSKMEELLAVRKELDAVRRDIAQMQGRLNLLSNLTALTTVTLTIYERKDYVPPTAPAFTTSIGRTFGDSVDLLADFGKGLLLFLIALAPWLPVIALVGIPTWLFLRRLVRRAITWRRPVEAMAASE
jgi:hypothetical protein